MSFFNEVGSCEPTGSSASPPLKAHIDDKLTKIYSHVIKSV